MSYSAREPGSTLRFGRYEVLFRIAAGGMAEVYAARMVGEGGFEKPVALKRMLPTLAEDERFVQMFLDEGRLAAHISSPHVVQTLDLGRAEDESLYLVMELVVGVSLSALIRAVLRKRAQFPVAVAVDILSQAAMGLHDAHEARTMYGQPLQIVHRDVSPQNILVDVSGRVRITDFGVARALERATQTQSGEVKGKLGYFAPEQVKGREIDRRTDVFALGIVAWETLAGRRLFAGDNPAQTLDFVMGMPVPRLDAIRSDVPAALADAVAHALERDLSQRTPSAGDFAEELRDALRLAGTAAVGTIVREHGGESLMKLEEGLRAQSPSSLSRVRRATGGSSPGAVATPGVPALPGAPAVPSVPAVPGVPGPVASGPGKDPTATEIALPWPMHDNAATREIVAPPSGVAGARPDGTVSGGYAAGYTAGGQTGGGYVGPAPTTVPLEPTLAPWIAPPPSPPPASSSMTRWVLVGGVAVVGLLGALGVAGWYFAGSHTPAEPRTMALPPL
ncbi:MAG: protein kinase, partial [Sandaracinaceae bacterium]|nr:protein kinase [Sandaracinaceae bacterium]